MQNAGASQAAKFPARVLALVAFGIVDSAGYLVLVGYLLTFTPGNVIFVIPEASETLKLLLVVFQGAGSLGAWSPKQSAPLCRSWKRSPETSIAAS